MSAVCVVLLKQVELHNRSVSQVNGAVSIFFSETRRLQGDHSVRLHAGDGFKLFLFDCIIITMTWLSDVIACCLLRKQPMFTTMHSELTPEPDAGSK